MRGVTAGGAVWRRFAPAIKLRAKGDERKDVAKRMDRERRGAVIVATGAVIAILAGFATGPRTEPDVGRDESRAPKVSSGNAWGQHAPRGETRPTTSDDGAPVPVYLGGPLRPNVRTDAAPEVSEPEVSASSFVDPFALLVGEVRLGDGVYVAPFAVIRADMGQPIWLGAGVSVAEGAVIHGLVARAGPALIEENVYRVGDATYSVFLGPGTVVSPQAQIEGPVWLEAGVFVGAQALVSRSHVGRGAVVEPAAVVVGVSIPAGRFVPAGVVVDQQRTADNLPEITPSYALRHRARAISRQSRQRVEAYGRLLD